MRWLLQWWNSERIYTSRCRFRTGKGCGSTSTLNSNGNEYKTNQEKNNLFKNILANNFSGQNNHDSYDNEFPLIPFVSVHSLKKLQAIQNKAIRCILRLTFNKDTGKYNSTAPPPKSSVKKCFYMHVSAYIHNKKKFLSKFDLIPPSKNV